MNKLLLFFYGSIISTIVITSVTYYSISQIKESNKTKINHSNYGSD
jgi:CHASE3 domain sensor protein